MRRLPFPTSIVVALILTAVLLPGSTLPDNPGIPGLDKIVHLILFMALAVAFHIDFDIRTGRRVALAAVIALAFSALTEALQLFVDGRSSEMLDMIADMVGFAVGLAARGPLSSLYRGFLKVVTRSSRRP